ncbi:hypothetical protein E2C01_088318 [Portunus trituberculatus]|uniref:Uncharacterized protein n=1 Tax=Portunus trituberculatus TaxID=210409 RepID=A0A5B7JF23_PORTR|nr:hypothetical protein [Portunus trituberculatus]
MTHWTGYSRGWNSSPAAQWINYPRKVQDLEHLCPAIHQSDNITNLLRQQTHFLPSFPRLTHEGPAHSQRLQQQESLSLGLIFLGNVGPAAAHRILKLVTREGSRKR